MDQLIVFAFINHKRVAFEAELPSQFDFEHGASFFERNFLIKSHRRRESFYDFFFIAERVLIVSYKSQASFYKKLSMPSLLQEDKRFTNKKKQFYFCQFIVLNYLQLGIATQVQSTHFHLYLKQEHEDISLYVYIA